MFGRSKQKYTSVAEMMQHAEELKVQVTEQVAFDNSASMYLRQQLQALYRDLLLTDLDLAVDKKLDCDLWNVVFRQLINAKQQKMKDRKNPKRSEVQASLNSFLESANGFYLVLLHEICNTFSLNDIFGFVDPRLLGLFASDCQTSSPRDARKVPKKSSCQYIVQDCLVHLGDLARYRGQNDLSGCYYETATVIGPSNGHPYNQIAIVLQGKREQTLNCVFNLMRSVSVKHAFMGAVSNLNTTLAKLSQDDNVDEILSKQSSISLVELNQVFCYFSALIFTQNDLDVAVDVKDFLIFSLGSILKDSKNELSWKNLVKMVFVINFNIWYTTHEGATVLEKFSSDTRFVEPERMSFTGRSFLQLAFEVEFSLFASLLRCASHAIESEVYLPACKIFLDWLLHNEFVMDHEEFAKRQCLWPLMVRLFNSISEKGGKIEPNNSSDASPLPEDFMLQGFLPHRETLRKLKLPCNYRAVLSGETADSVRTQRILALGEKLCEMKPTMIEVASVDGKLTFDTSVCSSGEDEYQENCRERFLKNPRRAPKEAEKEVKVKQAPSKWVETALSSEPRLSNNKESNSMSVSLKQTPESGDLKPEITQSDFSNLFTAHSQPVNASVDKIRSNLSKNVTFGKEPPKTIDRTPSPQKVVDIGSENEFPTLTVNGKQGERSGFNRQPNFLLPSNTPVIRAPMSASRFSSPRMAMSFPGISMNQSSQGNANMDQKMPTSPPGAPRYSQQKRESMAKNFFSMSNPGIIGNPGNSAMNSGHSQSSSLFPSAVLQPGLFPPFPPPPLPLDATSGSTSGGFNQSNRSGSFQNASSFNSNNNGGGDHVRETSSSSVNHFSPFGSGSLFGASFQNVHNDKGGFLGGSSSNSTNQSSMFGNSGQNAYKSSISDAMFMNSETKRPQNSQQQSSLFPLYINSNHQQQTLDSASCSFAHFSNSYRPEGNKENVADRQMFSKDLQSSNFQSMLMKENFANAPTRNPSLPNPTSLPNFDPIWSNSPVFAGLNNGNNNVHTSGAPIFKSQMSDSSQSNGSLFASNINMQQSPLQHQRSFPGDSNNKRPAVPPDLMSLETKPPVMPPSVVPQMGRNMQSSIVQSLFESSASYQRQNSDGDTNNLLAGLFGNMSSLDSINMQRQQHQQQNHHQQLQHYLSSGFDSNS